MDSWLDRDGGGGGGFASATSNAITRGPGAALSSATATGGAGGFGIPGQGLGGANATATATSTFAFANVRSIDKAVASTPAYYVSATATAATQADRSDQNFVKPDDSAYAFSTVLPDEADIAKLIGGASNIASVFLGPRDIALGTAILGNNDVPDGPVESFDYSASSTFEFSYRGDLLLRVIDGGGDFTITINGVQIVDEDFVSDTVVNLGSDFGPNIDLTIVTSNGAGTFVLGGAVPEPSTWAMMLVGFGGLALPAIGRRGDKPPPFGRSAGAILASRAACAANKRRQRRDDLLACLTRHAGKQRSSFGTGANRTDSNSDRRNSNSRGRSGGHLAEGALPFVGGPAREGRN